MCIRLTLEASDPETEGLLSYLEGRFGTNDVHKRTVLKAALGWLELRVPLTFSDSPEKRCTPLVVAPGEPQVSV